MAYRYVPMMKTKAGETDALQNSSPTLRAKAMPLLHVCETVSPKFAKQLGAAWNGPLTGLDGSFNYQRSGSTATFSSLLSALRNEGVLCMPSLGLADPQPYQQVARSLVDENGLIIKSSLANLSAVAGFISTNALAPDDVDLVIDLKHVAAIDIPTFAGYVISVLNQNAPQLASLRTVTLAAAAAPKDHSSLAYGANVLPRTDWQLWSIVSNNVSFRLDYGDYLTGHPDLTEPPGVAMANATVSARYTLDNDWLVIKGRSTSGPYGQPMGVQYMAHAGVIVSHAGFGGVGAWADNQISQAASGAPKMGSRQKWAGFAANRHVELVANRMP
jgi:Beta protein